MYEAARARFARHRAALADNPALRELYARWYRQVGARLPARDLGPWIELGAGPGLSAEFIPGLVRTDLVGAPWLALRTSAEALPFASARVGALVLFDVLHHLGSARAFFQEADRVLRPGGRVVLCEPCVSPLSYPVYRFLHEEGLSYRGDPWEAAIDGPGRPSAAAPRDPFAGNQAVPTRLFSDGGTELARRFPRLAMIERRRFAGLSYPLSGGFGRRPLLPLSWWRALDGLETCLPGRAFDLVGFRMLVVVEKRSRSG